MGDIYIFVIMAALFSPPSIAIRAAIHALCKKWEKASPEFLSIVIAAAFICIGIKRSQKIAVVQVILFYARRLELLNSYIENVGDNPWITWFVSDFISIGCSMLLLELCFVILHQGAAEQLLGRENKRQHLKKKWTKDFDYLYDKNQLIVGVSGSGKGTVLTKTIEQCLVDDSNMYITVVDGKSDIQDPYGFYNSMKFLAKKYKRDLVVINGTARYDLPHSCIYNPFDGLNVPEQIRDLVLSLMFDDSVELTAGSEHYRTMFSRYLLEVVTLMLKHEVKITLGNISTLLLKDNLLTFMDDSSNKVDIEEREHIKRVLEKCYTDAESSVLKLEMFMLGTGRNLFQIREGEGTCNLRTAYQNNQLCLVLLSAMDMPEFAAGIGRMVVADAKMLIASRMNGSIDKDRSCRLILDEFSSYTNAGILDIASRARSSQTVMYLSTQSLSDLKAISDNFLDSVLDNIGRFFIYRQNSPEAAEMAASIIGTSLYVQETLRSSNQFSMGESSNRLVREFICGPDDIKNMPRQHAVLVDKDKGTIQWIENTFVDMEE
ncbi:MAG: TraM recognition domain-containing protein [Mogibacterium sp.]|nr:TraM recognition domain-containing protein [Mogibacterium sp.]